MSIIRGALVLMLGCIVAACAGVYVAANRTLQLSPSSDGSHCTDGCRTSFRGNCVAPQSSLATPCREKAEQLRRQLRGECSVVSQEPFVLAGDSSPAVTERMYRSTIRPAWRAMAHQYFEHPPDRPITLLLFSDETTYRHYAERLFFDRNVSRFGYFKPGRRSVLVNQAWGDGPLLHELTHALMYFDFPEAAVWLREGLASLHETSSLVRAGKHWALTGRLNWRLDILQRQTRAERMQSLYELIQIVDFGVVDEAVNCAQARYFCLFLQQKDVLGGVYRRYRASHAEDPRGERAVLRAFPGLGWQDLDAEFKQWLMSLSEDVVARRAGE